MIDLISQAQLVSARSSHFCLPLPRDPDMKWIKQIRALPSDLSANDTLKVEYIDVNLNNSRKLMENVSRLAISSNENVFQVGDTLESLLRLRSARGALSWVECLKDSELSPQKPQDPGTETK